MPEAFNPEAAKADLAFQSFVDKVSPKNHMNQQPVFFAELVLILKILWEIYSILKTLGFFKAWWTTLKVKYAMKKLTVAQQEVALTNIRNGLVVSTRG